MPRNNSKSRKIYRKSIVADNGYACLSDRIRRIADRPGNSHKELSRLLGYDLRPVWVDPIEMYENLPAVKLLREIFGSAPNAYNR
jgi:hypothetical protein